MFRSIFRRLPPLLLLTLLAACGKPVIPYDRAATPQVHSIGIVTPSVPDDVTLYVAGAPGQSFGLVGALIDAGIEHAREQKFTASIKPFGFKPDAEFTTALLAAVQAQGYEARIVPTGRIKGSFLTEYKPDSGPPVDAWLDCVVGNWGYLAGGTLESEPYRPTFSATCELTRASDHRKLMRDAVWYNPLYMNPSGRSAIITISPDPQYAFPTSDALNAAPEKAVAGMRESLNRASQAVGGMLK